MKKYAVIVAGGSGQRMGGTVPKQFLPLNGKPVLWYTVHTFFEAFSDISIVLVLPSAYLPSGQELRDSFPNSHQIILTEGGNTRYDSVKNGLTLVEHPSVVFVHDGVRCLLSVALVRKCYDQALISGNAVPAVPATDSIRLVNKKGNRVVDRNNIRLVQTPQTFRSELLAEAFKQPYQDSFTDEATVVEKSGVTIILVEGEMNNIKITRPVDLLIAASLLNEKGPDIE
jgi:2-C-methyl-D-erythritol 4-phosphate cytidylyltransferase